MDLLTGIEATNGALGAQRTRLDVIAQNVLNNCFLNKNLKNNDGCHGD